MKKLMAWLLGSVTTVVSGDHPEEFLNLCGRRNRILWRMERREDGVLEISAPGRSWAALCRLAEEAGCGLGTPRRRGLPVFLLGFRRRWGLLAGLLLFLLLLPLLSRTVLTIDVEGNESLSDGEIISQLRLCGVGVGSYGPAIPVRAVENQMMLAMDRLTFFSLNLRGTRAEVTVREAAPAPEEASGRAPANVVAAASGIVTHIEPWMGDAQVQAGDTVTEGEVLISGKVILDPPPLVEGDLGTMYVRAAGEVSARTWRQAEAEFCLTAPGKRYTGESLTRCSLGLMGRRVKFYQNSGIPYERYDTITYYKFRALPGALPIVWEREVIRAYQPEPISLDRRQAETMLRQRLEEALSQELDQGEILRREWESQVVGDRLRVTLRAECREQIGRTEEIEAPDAGAQDEQKEQIHDRTDSQY